MRVRMTEGTPTFWYEEKVGQEFEVEEQMLYGGYQVKGMEPKKCIDPDDCEVLT